MRHAAAWAGSAGLAAALALAVPPEEPCGGLRFTEVGREAGIDFVHVRGRTEERHLPETMGSGLAWLDVDRDGWLDLYLVQSGPFPPDGSEGAANRIYLNRGDGTFVDATAAVGGGDRGYGQGAVAADVDGDGWTDLYVTNFGRDTLLRNRGGRLVDETEVSGIVVEGWSSSAAFADADGDGDLDLYVARYLDYDPAEPLFCGDAATGRRDYCHPHLFAGEADLYFENRGDGSFEEGTEAAGLAVLPAGKGLGVVFTDLDDDGRPDLYVANDTTTNFLFANAGGGRFEDRSLLSGAGLNRDGRAEAGMGIAVGDVDGDGDPDLAVTNFDTETNTLYRNLGGLLFEDVSAPSGFGLPSFDRLGFGIVLRDLDLDGDLDAYVANGHILERPTRQGVTYAEPDLLLLGDGAGRFRPASCGPPLETVGRGAAAADYDNDGDLDVAVATSGGRVLLLRNETTGRPGVGVRLVGRPPNTEAVGAVVRLVAEDGPAQTRWVLAGNSYESSGDRRVFFARPEGPARLDVRWPNGRRSDAALAELGADPIATIEEPR